MSPTRLSTPSTKACSRRTPAEKDFTGPVNGRKRVEDYLGGCFWTTCSTPQMVTFAPALRARRRRGALADLTAIHPRQNPPELMMPLHRLVATSALVLLSAALPHAGA